MIQVASFRPPAINIVKAMVLIFMLDLCTGSLTPILATSTQCLKRNL